MKVGYVLRFRFNTRQRRDFYDDMRRFVEAGQPPFEIIEKMISVYRRRRRLRWKVALLKKVAGKMRDGSPFGLAMLPFLPNEEATLMSAGESTNLRNALVSLTHLTTKRLEIRAKLMASLVPATAVLCAALAVMVVVMRMTLQQAVTMIPERVMDGLTLAPVYFGTAEFLISKGLYVLAGLIALAVLIVRSLTRWRPNGVRGFFDSWVPPWTLFRRMQAAFALVTSAAMMSAGIPFKSSIESMRRTGSPWINVYFKRINRGLGEGASEVDALLRSRLLPEDAADRMAVYALLNDFHEVMDRVAADSLEILVNTVDRYGKAMNTIVLVAVGGFILTTLFAFGEIGLAIDPKAMQNEALNQ